MDDTECPQCKKTLKSSAARLVQDSCGHKKCRLCLLADEAGCLQCSVSSNSDVIDNIINLVKPKGESTVKYENNQTAVITCNKFCSPVKTSDKNFLNKCSRNDSDSYITPQSNACKENSCEGAEILEAKASKRKYNFFILPSHISVLKGNQENGEIYKCNICNKLFHTKYYVKSHLSCIEGEKPHKCEKCKKAFLTKSQLENHSLTHLNVTPYVCDICNKSFKEKSKLKRHKVTHVDSASFVCQQCGKTFRSKEYLKVHSFTHEEDKPFSCKVCNKKFSNLSNMKKHLAKHSKEKNHMCDQCGKRFKLKWSLTVHRRSHVRLRLHVCGVCCKGFINSKELHRHKLSHLEEKAYSCGLCKTNFRRKDNVERHIKNSHPGQKIVIVKRNIEELIKKNLNKPLSENPPESVKEKPNAIKVITSQPLAPTFNRQTSINSPAINAPLKLAFKTKAFKNNYNIHGREYIDIEAPPKLQPRPYDPAESLNICKKILSPYSPPPTMTKSVTTVSEKQSTEICQKILNSAPVDNDQLKQHTYRSIKFKLPSNYKNLFKNDHMPNIQSLKPIQETRLPISNIASTTTSSYSSVLPINCATSVIVNSPYMNKVQI